MATFGVEGIRYFPHARAAGIDVSDLTYTFNRCNGFDSELRSAGHTRAFYHANTDCWETDIRDSDKGGDDVHWVDNVDIFWIETHGNNLFVHKHRPLDQCWKIQQQDNPRQSYDQWTSSDGLRHCTHQLVHLFRAVGAWRKLERRVDYGILLQYSRSQQRVWSLEYLCWNAYLLWCLGQHV